MIKLKIVFIISLLILFSNSVSAVSVQLTTSSYRQPTNIVTKHSEKDLSIWIEFEKNVTNFSYEILNNNLSISNNFFIPDKLNGMDIGLDLSTLDEFSFGQYTIPIRIAYDLDKKTYNETYYLNFSYIKDFKVDIIKEVKSIGDGKKEIQIMVESFVDLEDFCIELDSDGELTTNPQNHEINYLKPGQNLFNFSIKADDNTLSEKKNTYFEIKIRCKLKDGRELYYLSEQYTLNLEEESDNLLSRDYWVKNTINIILIILLISSVLLLIFYYRKEKR